MKRPCKYLDREGNRGAGCLLEFELNGGQGGSNRRHCDNCQKLAAKDRSAAHRASEDPQKRNNRQRDRRRKIARAAGRGYRTMKSMQPCKYRDSEGNPSKTCRGKFTPRSGIQIYCENCRPLARRDRQKVAALALYHADAKEYKAGRRGKAFARHEARLKRGRKSAANFHGRLRAQLARIKNGDYVLKPVSPGRPKLAPEETRVSEIGQAVEQFIQPAKMALKIIVGLSPRERADLGSFRDNLLALGFKKDEVPLAQFARTAKQLARRVIAARENMTEASVTRCHQAYLSGLDRAA
jgi:hypothetical protein